METRRNEEQTNVPTKRKSPRTLGVIGVFSLAAGAMISSGIFVLQGVAFDRAGPLVILAYGVAGLVAMVGTLGIVELATGMPRAGGDYFFITRSLGPLVGTVSGLLSWFALCAKSAFAIYGLSALVTSITGLPLVAVSLPLAALFVLINFSGAKSAVSIEVILVVGLLAIPIGLVVF